MPSRATAIVYLRETGASLLGAGDVAVPVLSVYPQKLIFRAYFFERYQPLFGTGWAMIAASALFAMTYHQSESLLLACIEHAIFGNFIFTIGLD